MNLRPRLIPAVIVAATVLLGVKVSDIVSLGTDRALAQAPSAAKPATGAPVDLTKQANGGAQPAAAAAAPNASATQSTAATPATPADAASAAAPDSTGSAPAGKDPLLLSPAEVQVLQELSQRRAALDKRGSDLDQQQVVLQAAEKRVDDKIAKLQNLQKSIQADVDKENAADDARMQSLVKIYQAMKPADAAQIIGQLDLPIALQLLSSMKEAKTAPILAAMEPAKAEAITTALAQKRNQPAATPAAASAAATPAPPSGS
ncbi:MAG TPA: hypothetical protein VGL83_08280 [Stellaceae bacterium]|jgi:flagellar motility protein MotE (MotC chaperone)